MAKHRFWVTIRQSGNRFRADVKAVTAPTLVDAEGIALRNLRTARLTKVDGKQWDRWEVRTSGSPHSLPVVVAHGDENGVTSSARQQGWWRD